jgi:ATP synthase protein I
MPFHNPIPDQEPPGKSSGIVGSIAQAEKMVQVAFILPCAGFIGWLAGVWLGKHLHQPWMPMAGIVLGIVSGLIGVVRMAIAASAGADIDPDAAKRGKDDPGGRP